MNFGLMNVLFFAPAVAITLLFFGGVGLFFYWALHLSELATVGELDGLPTRVKEVLRASNSHKPVTRMDVRRARRQIEQAELRSSQNTAL